MSFRRDGREGGGGVAVIGGGEGGRGEGNLIVCDLFLERQRSSSASQDHHYTGHHHHSHSHHHVPPLTRSVTVHEENLFLSNKFFVLFSKSCHVSESYCEQLHNHSLQSPSPSLSCYSVTVGGAFARPPPPLPYSWGASYTVTSLISVKFFFRIKYNLFSSINLLFLY